MDLFKDEVTGEWVEGYPYLQWPLDKHGNTISPTKMHWWTRIYGYKYEYMRPGGAVETFIAMDRKEVVEPSISESKSFRERLDEIQSHWQDPSSCFPPYRPPSP